MSRRLFCLMASFARMQGRAEAIALSGPHATGVPVRIAEQKRWISMRIGRGPVPVLDAVDADAVLVFRFPAIVSEDCATAAPSRGETAIAVDLLLASSSKNIASDSCSRIRVPFVP